MSSVEELNRIATSCCGYINFNSLEIGKPNKILGFGIFKSDSYGKERDCVRVDINDGYLVLPERFDNAAQKITKMNVNNLYIIYKGRAGNRLIIEFKEK